MDLQSEKIELVKLLLETESREVINEIKAVFNKQGFDFFDELPQHVKNCVDAGLREIEAGDFYDHDWVMQDIKSKYAISSKVVKGS